MTYKKVNVYLAGKIEANGWRQQIVDIRNGAMFWGEYNINTIKNLKLQYNKNIDITGPFFLSCDHSCYHGENSHGLGIQREEGCYCEKTFSEEQVNDICLSQIRKSDIVFAYINDDTCYGTLYELGYAAALGKKIAILFDLPERIKKMWFITKNADIVKLQKVYKEYTVEQHFDEMINELRDKINAELNK